MIIRAKNSQRGAAAVETSLVFSLFFSLLWGGLSYSLPFFMLQVMNNATSEAVRAAVAADPNQGQVAYTAKLTALATSKLATGYSWLPASMQTGLVSSITVGSIAGQSMLIVKLTYPNYGANPIIPVLNLPGIGPVPNISGNLKAESRFRLERSF